ncbi:MAG: glycerophosphodiester phosphodiesterase family protein [Armatimonadota bacterium]|nr:glycerophosphodiester phosphodiesterase family protein [Armatimonadota bacterium]
MALVIAHRGDPSCAPENTVAAFRAAVDLGVDMVELDVQLSRDRHPLVMHDLEVDRCTNGHGRVAEMDLAQLRALDAGAWFSPRFVGERIPTLEEALSALPFPVQVNLHLKPFDPSDDTLERIVLEHIDRFALADRLVVVHHELGSLERLRAWRPSLTLCLLPPRGVDGRGYVDVARAHGLRVLQPGRNLMSAEFLAYAHQHGMHANVFYADTAEDMARYLDWGVDGILSNQPARLQEVLRARKRDANG